MVFDIHSQGFRSFFVHALVLSRAWLLAWSICKYVDPKAINEREKLYQHMDETQRLSLGHDVGFTIGQYRRRSVGMLYFLHMRRASD